MQLKLRLWESRAFLIHVPKDLDKSSMLHASTNIPCVILGLVNFSLLLELLPWARPVLTVWVLICALKIAIATSLSALVTSSEQSGNGQARVVISLHFTVHLAWKITRVFAFLWFISNAKFWKNENKYRNFTNTLQAPLLLKSFIGHFRGLLGLHRSHNP